MIVHPNPMIKTGPGRWIDTHFKRVEVRPMTVNWGSHRQRWVVYFRHRTAGPAILQTRHITEEQAVVSAQTLANRLKRLSDKKKRRTIKKLANVELTITDTDREDMLAKLMFACDSAKLGQTAKAREIARDLVHSLNQSFKLNV